MSAAKDEGDRKLTPLGERLMKAAEAASFTPTSLARAAGLASGHMTKLLYVPQSRFDVAKLERLCDLLSVRMHWLATGRLPMREGDPLSALEEAKSAARKYGVPEDVFWFVTERDGEIERSEQDWFVAFQAEHQLRLKDEKYAKNARRVAMDDQRNAKVRAEKEASNREATKRREEAAEPKSSLPPTRSEVA